MLKQKLLKYSNFVIIALGILFVDILLWKFAPNSFHFGMTYNSYFLQAKAWLTGHLNLPQNYSWLEIATYQGKFYISFPPIPSVILLPFVAIQELIGHLPHNFQNFVSDLVSSVVVTLLALWSSKKLEVSKNNRWLVCAGFFIISLVGFTFLKSYDFYDNQLSNVIAVTMSIVGACFAYKIAIKLGVNRTNATLLSLILTACSGFMFLMCNGAVWFIAQNFALDFMMISIYLAITESRKHTKWSLFFYALAVGCRPLNAIWIILLAFLIWNYKGKFKIKEVIIDMIPGAIVAIFLAVLNFSRFGNPIEFGHNYLPEFEQNEQFGIKYLGDNLKTLFKMPTMVNGKLHFDQFNGIFFILPCVIFISFILSFIADIIKRVIFNLRNTNIRTIEEIELAETFDNEIAIEKIEEENIDEYEKPPEIKSNVLVNGWREWTIIGICVLVTIIHILLLCMHQTMGGWHWGHRYITDVTPAIFLANCYFLRGKKWLVWVLSAVLIFGFLLNLWGSIAVYGVIDSIKTWFQSLPLSV